MREFLRLMALMGAVLMPMHLSQGKELAPASNPEVWLKADAGVIEEEGKVAVWKDQSGNGHDAQQTNPEWRPVLEPSSLHSGPALYFQRQQILLTDPVDLKGTEVQVIVVVQLETQDNGYQYVLVYGEPGIDHTHLHGGFYLYNTTSSGGGNGVEIVTGPKIGIPALDWLGGSTPKVAELVFRIEGPNDVSVNGTLINSVPGLSGLLPYRPLQIGAELGSEKPNLGMSGFLAEILIYNRELSLEERHQTLGYLQEKYGISP